MYKFGKIEVPSKTFNSVYQTIDISTIDLEKIRISEGVVANKHDTRYTISYEIEPGQITPLYIKTPRDCVSAGVSRYNESSPWKMGFNVSQDEAWVKQYVATWEKVEELLGQKLEGVPLSNSQYINSKLITWDGEIRTSVTVPYSLFLLLQQQWYLGGSVVSSNFSQEFTYSYGYTPFRHMSLKCFSFS